MTLIDYFNFIYDPTFKSLFIFSIETSIFLSLVYIFLPLLNLSILLFLFLSAHIQQCLIRIQRYSTLLYMYCTQQFCI